MAALENTVNQAIADFDSIQDAIEDMGVSVPQGTSTSEYGGLIRQIAGGGGVNDVRVDGTSVVTSGVANIDLTGKVNKVAGKGLSTNDYTTNEKNKLAGIESGAEVNTPVDNALSSSSTNPVQNKVLQAEFDYQYGLIVNKVDKVTGKGLSTNDYTNAEKNKLAGLDNYTVASGGITINNTNHSISIPNGDDSGLDFKTDMETGVQYLAVNLKTNGGLEIDANNKLVNTEMNVIEGVQVNGTDLTPDASKKVNIPIANGSSAGVVYIDGTMGIGFGWGGYIATIPADTSDIDARTNSFKPIVPYNLDYAVRSVQFNVETLNKVGNDYELVSNKIYTLGAITGTCNFEFPTVSSSSPYIHSQILVYFSTGATAPTVQYSHSNGMAFVDGEIPTIDTNSNYRMIAEYNFALSKWSVGLIKDVAVTI